MRELAVDVAYRLSKTAMESTKLFPIGTQVRVAKTDEESDTVVMITTSTPPAC